jgi:hypothetical protein
MRKYKQFTLDTEVFGQTREIVWEETEGVFAIVGVKSTAEAMRLLDVIADPQPPDVMPMPHAEFREFVKERYGYDIGAEAPPANEVPPTAEESDTAAAPVSKPVDFSKEPISISVKFEDSFPDRVAKEALAIAAASTSSPGDMGVFGRMTKLSEVVEELRKRGHATYEAIAAECYKLAAMGDICPPIDHLHESKTLESRLKTHLAGKGIAVPGVT